MKVQTWIGKSRIAGKGLFAGQDINKETIITRYLGTKISKAQSAQALAQGNAYICSLNDRYDIDGNTLKNPARYINHSCDPQGHLVFGCQPCMVLGAQASRLLPERARGPRSQGNHAGFSPQLEN